MIHLERYRIFYYVATYQSISRAAAQLYISQPAVTKSIRKLEEELNCALFLRTPHGSMLTEEGRLLFYHVSRALKEFEDAETKVLQQQSIEHQQISIGVTESALYTVLMPGISRYRKEYPATDFQIRSGSTGSLLRLLEEGEIDIAIGVTPVPKHLSAMILELCEVRDVFFAHQSFSVDDSVPLLPQVMCTLPIVGVRQASSAGSHITEYFQSLGLHYAPAFTVETSTHVLPFVENGLAIGLAPHWVLQASARAGELRQLNTTFSIPARMVFLASASRHQLSPACRNFIDIVASGIQE